ncbi:alpha/beta-hydrolase [Aspergillus ibericus CBS 121593]|uniref:Alpha/beta-hydrolase n=1 Tax=Aspergillus ibericus CBS 121593 TaxID=1448316 RepID=A0A395GWX5_9EURO|nr:alpha/beta-hydrolase [Aspergillus ibericus CBS 121593]RAK99187.1 alpha/beta-hydrolase [Aspergillus ibericus CBS 121593]
MDFENPSHLRAAAQKLRSEDDPVKGPIWVSKFTIPKPIKDTSRDLLLALIDMLNDKHVRYDRPDSQPLSFEWVGLRNNVGMDTPQPSLSEVETFQRLNSETQRPLAILYLYGGTFTLNTPSCYRKTASFLAKATGSKVLMVHQRLAPQNPFPAALLDVFQAYLTLLAPPPGSPHEAIPPSSIVVTGDSSGTCLALSLLQILLRLQRQEKSIVFHGQTIQPTVPAGLTLVRPITELTNSLPSYERNMHTDIFPVPVEKLPFLQPGFPTCSIWPTQPPRADLYCEAGMLAHPMVSPAASEDWSGSCPIWMASGQEQTIDAALLIAQVAHSQGVSVTHQEYENMPHTFFFFFRHAPQTKKLMGDWVQAILRFSRGEKPASSASYVQAKGLVVEPKDIERLVPFSVAELRELMWKKTFGFKVPLFHREGRASL